MRFVCLLVAAHALASVDLARPAVAIHGRSESPRPRRAAQFELVVMYTESDGSGPWATHAAVQLWAEGIFADPAFAQIALVPYADAYENNTYACVGAFGGLDWSASAAGCWLRNCSSGPAPGIGPDGCWGSAGPGTPGKGVAVCRHGARECAIKRWQATGWIAMIEAPAVGLPFFHCLHANATAPRAVDLVAKACADEVGVSDYLFDRLSGKVHSWVGDEEVGGMGTVQATHLRRSDATHGPRWPHITLGSGDSLQAEAYSGPPTTDGLRRAICAAGAKYSKAAPPAACGPAVE
jgi:hypothetical protein